ncbi:MAG: response regulator transcription factor [Verrucomicrobiales bacterium]|nr:response regulator transcription factor [Verrucomicrobiales bacterium]
MTGPSGTTIRVAIVENETRYRGFLRTIIEGTPGFECVGAYASADLALAVIATHPPDLLLLDLELPGLQGEQAIPRFLELLPNLSVVVVTCHKSPDRLFPCLEAGAVGYLVKPLSPTELIEALHEVRNGGSPMSGPIARLVLNSFKRRAAGRKDLDALTARELEVLRGIATGSLPEDLVATLGISLRTVQTHLRNIYKKLHVNSRSQAVARFLARTSEMPGS